MNTLTQAEDSKKLIEIEVRVQTCYWPQVPRRVSEDAVVILTLLVMHCSYQEVLLFTFLVFLALPQSRTIFTEFWKRIICKIWMTKMKASIPGTGNRGKENVTREKPNKWPAPLLSPQDDFILFARHLIVCGKSKDSCTWI